VLRNLLLAPVPHVYVNSLSHDITGFGNVSALTIMTSLWERYGTITQAELVENLTRMSSPWNPPQPIEDLFLQLNRGSQFASNGSEPIALSQVLRIGYTLIANTGLFAEACREWRRIRDIDKNMDTFQVLFTEADPLYSRLPAKRDTAPATPQPLSPLRLLRQPQPFHLQRNTHWPWHAFKPRLTPLKRNWPP